MPTPAWQQQLAAEREGYLEAFLTERCTTSDGLSEEAWPLYSAYSEMMAAKGLHFPVAVSVTSFGKWMGARFRRSKRRAVTYHGVALK